MADPIKVTVEFDTHGLPQLRRGAETLDHLHARLNALGASALGTGRALRIAEADLQRFSNTLRHNLGGALTHTNALFQGFYTFMSGFVRLGIYAAVGQIAAMTAGVYSLGKAFLNINQQLGELELTMKSVFGTVTVARQIRDELALIAVRSPLPFGDLTNIARSASAIPSMSTIIGRETIGGTTGPGSFMNRFTRLVEQLVTFRPDKTATDATFAIREAVTGELRSLIRRFEFPKSLLVSASGKSIETLKDDPIAMFEAMEKAISGIITPQAVEELARQPRYLMERLIEQSIELPLLQIGRSGEERGQDLYNVVIEYFFNVLESTASFVQGKFAPLAAKISQNLHGIFDGLINAFEQVSEAALTMLGFGRVGELASMDKIERAYLMLERATAAVSRSLPGFVDGAMEFAKRYLPVLRRIGDVLLWLGRTLAGIFQANVVAGFASLYFLRDAPTVLGVVFRILNEGITRLSERARLARGLTAAMLANDVAALPNSVQRGLRTNPLPFSTAASGGVTAPVSIGPTMPQVVNQDAVSGRTIERVKSVRPTRTSAAFHAVSAFGRAAPAEAPALMAATRSLIETQRKTAEFIRRGYKPAGTSGVLFHGPRGFVSSRVTVPIPTRSFEQSRMLAPRTGVTAFADPRTVARDQRSILANPANGFGERRFGTAPGIPRAIPVSFLGTGLGQLVSMIGAAMITTGVIIAVVAAVKKILDLRDESRQLDTTAQLSRLGFTSTVFDDIRDDTERAINATQLYQTNQSDRDEAGRIRLSNPKVTVTRLGLEESTRPLTTGEAAFASERNLRSPDGSITPRDLQNRGWFDTIGGLLPEPPRAYTGSGFPNNAQGNPPVTSVATPFSTFETTLDFTEVATLLSNYNADIVRLAELIKNGSGSLEVMIAGVAKTIDASDAPEALHAFREAYDQTYRAFETATKSVQDEARQSNFEATPISLSKPLSNQDASQAFSLQNMLAKLRDPVEQFAELSSERFSPRLNKMRASISNLKDGVFTRYIEQAESELSALQENFHPSRGLGEAMLGAEARELARILTDVQRQLSGAMDPASRVFKEVQSELTRGINAQIGQAEKLLSNNPDDEALRLALRGLQEVKGKIISGFLPKTQLQELFNAMAAKQAELIETPIKSSVLLIGQFADSLVGANPATLARMAGDIDRDIADSFEKLGAAYSAGAGILADSFREAADRFRSLGDIDLVPPELQVYAQQDRRQAGLDSMLGIRDALPAATQASIADRIRREIPVGTPDDQRTSRIDAITRTQEAQAASTLSSVNDRISFMQRQMDSSIPGIRDFVETFSAFLARIEGLSNIPGLEDDPARAGIIAREVGDINSGQTELATRSLFRAPRFTPDQLATLSRPSRSDSLAFPTQADTRQDEQSQLERADTLRRWADNSLAGIEHQRRQLQAMQAATQPLTTSGLMGNVIGPDQFGQLDVWVKQWQQIATSAAQMRSDVEKTSAQNFLGEFSGSLSQLEGLSRTPGLAGSANRASMVARQGRTVNDTFNALNTRSPLAIPSVTPDQLELLARPVSGNRAPVSTQVQQANLLGSMANDGIAAIERRRQQPLNTGELAELELWEEKLREIAANAEQARFELEGTGNRLSSFGLGFSSAMDEMLFQSRDFSDFGRTMADSLAGVSSSLTDIIMKTQSASEAFSAFGLNLLRVAIDSLGNKLVQNLLGAAFGGGGGGIGGFFSNLFGSAATGTVGAGLNNGASGGFDRNLAGRADGGPITKDGKIPKSRPGVIPGHYSDEDNRVYAMATGEFVIPASVVRRKGPAYFYRYLSGNEETVPVKFSGSRADGGMIGSPMFSAVGQAASSGGSVNAPVSFEINISNGNATAKETSDPAQQTEAARNMARGLQMAVQVELQRQQRQGGSLRQYRR